MSQNNTQLIVHLTPDSLSIAHFRKGTLVQSEQTDLHPNDWESMWSEGLISLDQPLRQLLSRFPCKRKPPVTLVYCSPSVTQQVFVSDHTPTNARSIGEQKLRESVGLENPVESFILDDSTNRGGRCSTLVYSDQEEQLRSLYAWLNRCNLNLRAFIPQSVASIEATADFSLQVEPETAIFYIGPDVSVMAFANEQGLQLIRSAQIGYRKLSEGYTQAFCSANQSSSRQPEDIEDDESAILERQREERLLGQQRLFEFGIPFSTESVEGIDLRSTVLPVLSPVLQRYCIEIKQTFRFGLGDIPAPKYLTLVGPGAAIPHLSKALTEHIDMHIQVDPASNAYQPDVAFSQGSIELLTSEIDLHNSELLPKIAKEAKNRTKLNRVLAAGAAIAAVAIGGEYTLTSFNNMQFREEIRQDSPELNQVNAFNEQVQSISTLSTVMSDVSELVTESVRGVPRWDIALLAISDHSNDSIQISELRADYSDRYPTIEVSGHTLHRSSQSPGQVLNRFIHRLKSSQGIADITLGATSRISTGNEQWGLQFSMKVRLDPIKLPHEQLASMNSTMEGTP